MEGFCCHKICPVFYTHRQSLNFYLFMLLQQTHFYHTWHLLVYCSTALHPLTVRLTKTALQPLLPKLILYRLAPSLSHLTSLVLLPHSDRLVCLRSAVATFTCSLVWSVRYSRLFAGCYSKPSCVDVLSDCIKFVLAMSRRPQCAEVQPSPSHIHANTLCKAASQLVRVHLAWHMISLRLPWRKICFYWVCAGNTGRHQGFAVDHYAVYRRSQCQRNLLHREKRLFGMTETTCKMSAARFVVSILFFSSSWWTHWPFKSWKVMRYIICDWTNIGKYQICCLY